MESIRKPYDGKKVGQFLERVFAKEKGSLIIEGAIVFPLVMIFILLLITLAIMLHDRYVFELTAKVLMESSDTYTTTEMKELLAKRTITDPNNFDIRAYANNTDKKGGYNLTYSLDLPVLQKQTSFTSFQSLNKEPLRDIMYIELVEDTIDSFSISEVVKSNHRKVLDSVLSALESH
jgi:hypothetical protein